jgi:hypothetical protein
MIVLEPFRRTNPCQHPPFCGVADLHYRASLSHTSCRGIDGTSVQISATISRISVQSSQFLKVPQSLPDQPLVHKIPKSHHSHRSTTIIPPLSEPRLSSIIVSQNLPERHFVHKFPKAMSRHISNAVLPPPALWPASRTSQCPLSAEWGSETRALNSGGKPLFL